LGDINPKVADQLKYMVFWSLIINLLGFFVVNNGAAMNIYNPQMMQCFVCHPIQLEHIDAHVKHKGTSRFYT